jgi:hypothetical protein
VSVLWSLSPLITFFINNSNLYIQRFMVLKDTDMLCPINVNQMAMSVRFNDCGLVI